MKKLTFWVGVILYSLVFIWPDMGFSQEGIPSDFCISEQEKRLYLLINNYRIKNDLPEIQLSKSLSFVAKTHVKDLYDNRPDTSICNLNSWSDKGRWTACCHSPYLPKPECILNKPRELTTYQHDAHELAFWEMTDTHPDSVFGFWTDTEETRNFLINEGKWKKHKWVALGVGLYHGYASIWLGEARDPESEPLICGFSGVSIIDSLAKRQDDKINIITTAGKKFYLIYGSYTVRAEAEAQARKYREKGFPGVMIVKSNEKYRIALSKHNTHDEATRAKSALSADYSGAWILNY